ncbi:DUF922 domain-containing protein [Polluticoccus soli]|uniref:DUF922 domain-containing protein n=1 Tax=Polluticoccus soli TaxID=3034150 RepID=UPI0023E22A82|nr:hypothetical protein [Flavipsychrobacter sp. JY13-12]
MLSKGLHLPPSTKIIKPAKTSGYSPREFYIASVVDNRDDTSNIGQMHAGSARQLVTLNLPGGTAKGLYNFIQHGFRQNEGTMPIDLHITNFQIEESFKGNMHKADLSADLEFYSDGVKLNQYTYNSYVSSGIDASEHIGKLVTQLTEQFMKDMDIWLKDNKPTLTPGISVNVEMLTETDDADLIVYDPTRPLRRSDFMGDPDEMSLAGAITYSGIQIKYNLQTFNRHKMVNISVIPYFHKMNSWWRANNSTELLLAHEQIHFDITAIAACELMKKLKAAHFTPDNFTKELEAIQKQSEKDRSRMQQQYDRETNHSLIKTKQAEWERTIKDQLNTEGYFSAVTQ